MSYLRTTPLKWLPSADEGVAVQSGGNPAWTTGAYVEIVASMAAASQLAALCVGIINVGAGQYNAAIDIAVGGAGAEVVIATKRLVGFGTGGSGDGNLPFAVPIDKIPAGSRVSARVRDSDIAAPIFPISIGYFEGLDSDHSTTRVCFELPANGPGVSLTPNGTAWANSAWVELTSGISTLIEFALLNGWQFGTDGIEYEFDLGTGAAGVETVLTTLAGHSSRAEMPHATSGPYLPRPYPIAANTRIAVRLRKAGTTTTAFEVSAEYYNDPLDDDEDEEVEFENADQDGTIGLTWSEWTGRDSATRVYAKVPLPDDADYYHGWKEPRVAQWYPIRRALSDRTGQYEGISYGALYNDKDRTIRGLLAGSVTKDFVNNPFVIRMIADEDRRAKLTPRTVARGIVRDYAARSGFQFELVGQDTLSVKFAASNLGGLFPTRLATREDFPNVPDATYRAACPILCGNLTNAAENLALVPVIYTGLRPVNGTDYHEFLVAGHAVKSIDSWYVDDVLRNASTAGAGQEYLIPGYQGYTDAFGSAKYRDINGRRYTFIYVTTGSVDGQDLSEGTARLTMNLQGLEDNADGTGTLITDLFDQYYHVVNNFILQDYQSGAWLEPATFADDATVEKIHQASFDACKAQAEARLAGGYPGGGIIGLAGAQTSIREVLAKFNISGDVDCGFNRKCQFMVSMVPDAAAVITTGTVVTDLRDVIAGSFEVVDSIDELFTGVVTQYAPDLANNLDRNYLEVVFTDADRAFEIGEEKIYFLRLDMTRSGAVASDVGHRWLERHMETPRRAKWREPLRGTTDDLGDVILMTHREGIGSDGWTENPLRITRHDLNPDDMSVEIEAWDLGRYATFITTRGSTQVGTTMAPTVAPMMFGGGGSDAAGLGWFPIPPMQDVQSLS